jgi:hypothetical protein
MTEEQWLKSNDPILMVDQLYALHPETRVSRDTLLKLFAAAAGPCSTCRAFGQRPNVSPYAYARFAAGSFCLGASIKAGYLRDIVGSPWKKVSLNEPLRCRRGHIDWGVVKKKSFPVPLSMCVICNEEGPPWAAVLDGEAPKWLTPEVVAIAEAAGRVHERHRRIDHSHLLVLADACEEAGCYDARCPDCRGSGNQHQWFDAGYDVPGFQRAPCKACNATGRVASEFLAHLRSPHTHVAGCWALSLIIGYRKET